MCIMNYQMLFIENLILRPADLIAKHPLDFVTHVFPVGGAKMNRHPVGGFADFLYKRGTFVSLRSI